MHRFETSMNVGELAKESYLAAKKFFESDTVAAEATKTVLALVALSPIAVVGAMAPNVFLALKPFMKKGKYTVRQVGRALDILDRSKYLSVRHTADGRTSIVITKKGMRQARKLSLETVKLSMEVHWNGKWHLLFYDIPVKYNAARMAFHRMVGEVGMYQLQKSLWVYPHVCEAEILFIARFFGVEQYVNFAVADSLFDEEKLLRHFQLTSPH
ncbi:MAG: Transcriptional regulator, PaaX family [Parcubacteria group bacterium GW2011_GWA2_49_9]|nr:MAG: Transcriptional regulator, PaaX family [Parcubacteria group bacterium GW2011_GWA2_49_9]